MALIPAKRQRNWQNAGQGRFSSISSGTTETRAMFRKPPAVKGRMYMSSVSRSSLLSKASATRAPNKPTRAVLIWALAASHLVFVYFSLVH